MAARLKLKRGCDPEDRREAIIDAAAEIFLERGYAGATTDRLIERIGGSKETVYSHFGNKAGLFEAVMARNSRRIIEQIIALDPSRPVREELAAFGRGYLGGILKQEKLAMLRLAIGEQTRHPELGRLFWRYGPGQATARLETYIRGCVERGGLTVADPHRAAAYFLAGLRSDIHLRALLDPATEADETAIAQHVDFCVEAFLRLAGPR